MKKTIDVDITTIQQLIDLNGELTNFKIDFIIKSVDGTDFFAVVTDQTKLDNNIPPAFQNTSKGEISGSIVSDKNVFQNHYIALKSNNPTKCQIYLDIEEIPPARVENFNLPPQQQQFAKPMAAPRDEESFFSKWKWVLLIVAVVAIFGGYYVYNTYFSSSVTKPHLSISIPETIESLKVPTPKVVDVVKVTEVLPQPAVSTPKPMVSKQASVASSVKSTSSNANINSILSRLNKLSL